MSTASQGKPLYRRYMEKQRSKQGSDVDLLAEEQLDCVCAGMETCQDDCDFCETKPKKMI